MSHLALIRSAIFVISAVILPCVAVAQPATQERPVTQEQVEELEENIRILDRKLEIQEEEALDAAEEEAEEGTTVSASDSGFAIESNDGAYELKLRGLAQGDARVYADDEDTVNDTFFVRRARIILDGTVGDFVSFRIMPDFGGSDISLIDAYVDVATPLEYTDSDDESVSLAVIRGGKFKSPVSLERLQSASWIHMIERGYGSELAANRDIGVELYSGDLINGRTGSLFNYAFAFTNGAPDGRDSPVTNPDDNFEYAARVGVEPIDGLGLGIAGSYGDKEGGLGEDAEDFLPRYRSPGQQTIFEYAETTAADGQQLRWSPQAYFYGGPLGMQAEYVQSRIDVTNGAASDELTQRGGQATAVYVLTGEDASYSGVEPDAPVGSGGWGAWELAARYARLELDDGAFPLYADPAESVSEAVTWGVGVNWYLTKNLKAVLNYFQTDFDGAGGIGFPKEKTVLSRLQVSF